MSSSRTLIAKSTRSVVGDLDISAIGVGSYTNNPTIIPFVEIHLDILKSENQRLKEENGALIRVISKLSK